MAQVQNAIRLKQFIVTAVDFKLGSEASPSAHSEVGDKLAIEFGHSVVAPSKGASSFLVQFELNLNGLSTPPFVLKVRAMAEFETQSALDDVFAQSPLIQVNAPAIAFPYLRSFVSTLTVNSGIGAIVLPAMSFQRPSQSQRSAQAE